MISDKIAIVGVALELPSGTYSDKNLNQKSFFDFLLNYGQSYEKIPSSRFNVDDWFGPNVGQISTTSGAFLKGIDKFDNLEFGISSKDAKYMAPATRKLLETCFLSLLDSGIDYRNKNVGCYTSGTSVEITNVGDPDVYDAHGSFAGYPSMIANRISYHLDLLGPSVPTDTACSSTGTALHLAVQALRTGDCEAAVVAGCQLNHRFNDWFNYSQGGLLAPDGKCKPFDASADGFARGEGCVALVVKPLQQALLDKDHVYGTILSTAINSSGGTAPAGAPVAEGQHAAMVQAFQNIEFSPQDVDYVEVHATGTAKGDPTEVNWVGKEFKRESPLYIGSVKGNIGHTEIVALLASLVKVLGIFQYGIIPPNVNCQTLNPSIQWHDFNLHVPTKPTSIHPRSSSGHLISLASSGIGGSNAHVVVQGSPFKFTKLDTPKVDEVLLIVGGLTPRSTTSLVGAMEDMISTPRAEFPELSTILGRRAKQMTWRTYTVVSSTSPIPQFGTARLSPRNPDPIVFVFSGQGPQHHEMGRQLYEIFPIFRQSICEMDQVHIKLTKKSLIHDYGLFGPGSPSLPHFWPISTVLPSITVYQCALFDLLVHLGIRPAVVVGHSAGEAAVMYASGAASKEMAVELSVIRGQIFTELESPGGSMAALACTSTQAETLILQEELSHPTHLVEIACFNSQADVTISGTAEGVECVIEAAERENIWARKIRTHIPVHSSLMDQCKAKYMSSLDALFANRPLHPIITTYSSFTAGILESFTAEYFWQSTRGQVRFQHVIEEISQKFDATYIEISPHPVLLSYISSTVGDAEVISVSRRPHAGTSLEYRELLNACGALTVIGHNCIDFVALNQLPGAATLSDIPDYPFEKRNFPLYPHAVSSLKQIASHNGPLNHKFLKLNKDTHPMLAEHVIKGEPIMAAAGFIEMALEFGATSVMNIKLHALLSLSVIDPISVRLFSNESYWKVVSIHNTPITDIPQTERTHADGYMSFEHPEKCQGVDISAIHERCPIHVGLDDFYPSLSYFSSYGKIFQRVVSFFYGHNEAIATIRGLDADCIGHGNYILHPAILDACIHPTAYREFLGDLDPEVYFLPAFIGSLVLHQFPQSQYFPDILYSHLKLTEWRPDSIKFDIMLLDIFGTPLCSINNLVVQKHRVSPLPVIRDPFHVVWQPVPHINILNCNEQDMHTDWTSFVFQYTIGKEEYLQWCLGGLNADQNLNVVILPKFASDYGAVLGLTRAIQREYPTWQLRTILLPSHFRDEEKMTSIKHVATVLDYEPEIMVTSLGDCFAPRMVPLSIGGPHADRIYNNIPVNHVRVQVESSLQLNGISFCYAKVMDTNNILSVIVNSWVLTFTSDLPGKILTVHATHVVILPPAQQYPELKDIVAAMLVILTLGPSTIQMPQHLTGLKFLITHKDTQIGSSILRFLSSIGIKGTGAGQHMNLLGMSTLGYQQFDIIISGHSHLSYIHVLQSLLHPTTGELLLWNYSEQNLLTKKRPVSLTDAVVAALDAYMGKTGPPSRALSVDPELSQLTSMMSSGDGIFNLEGTYLLIGGIGSLGAHIALYLFQHGVRHLVLTSRSGLQGLKHHKKRLALRIIDYLMNQPDLRLDICSVDGSSTKDMMQLIHSVDSITGCFLLSSTVSDAAFANTHPENFRNSHLSKIKILQTLHEVLQISQLDFVIAFSSVSGLFGSAGQSSYDAANTAMEAQIDSMGLKNVFSFICPGILDSTMLTGHMQGSQTHAFDHILPWSITTQEMLLWLHHAIRMHIRSHSFTRFIPALDWNVMDKFHGMNRLGRDLLTSEVTESEHSREAEGDRYSAIAKIIQDTLHIPSTDFITYIPFTSYGIDSVSASQLSVALRPFIKVSQIQLLADLSMQDLIKNTDNQKENKKLNNEQAQAPSISNNISTKSFFLEKYLHLLTSQIAICDRTPPKTTLDVVLLTGTTGSLGCHILFQLLQRTDVIKIYSLNRESQTGEGILERHMKQFTLHGLSTSALQSKKLNFLEIKGNNFDYSLFKVEHPTYIIHCSWKVHFSDALTTFEGNLKTTCDLLTLASMCKATFTFISTISIFQELMEDYKACPEIAVLDSKAQMPNGYIQSKWIGERLVQKAHSQFGLSTKVIRVGLLSGGTNGYWNPRHWVPAMLESGLHLRCLPQGSSYISWIPVHLAAAAIIGSHNMSNNVIHLVHPKPVNWNSIMGTAASYLNIPTVPYLEWLTRLKLAADNQSSTFPACVLIDFFNQSNQNLRKLEFSESMGLLPCVEMNVMKLSTLYEDSAEISPTDVISWIQCWEKCGFLQIRDKEEYGVPYAITT